MAGLCLQVATTHFIAAAANFCVPRILSAHGLLGVALALLVPGAHLTLTHLYPNALILS